MRMNDGILSCKWGTDISVPELQLLSVSSRAPGVLTLLTPGKADVARILPFDIVSTLDFSRSLYPSCSGSQMATDL